MTGSLDPDRRDRYLRAMGIDAWRARAHQPVAPAVETPKPVDVPAPTVSGMDLATLENTVAACTRCSLHAARHRTVFGAGDPSAQWLFVGEAPGADEDRQGLPFVGRAGQLLNTMLGALGLQRESVYIANVLKCRPPGNRDPGGEEVLSCEPYLLRQVALIEPKVIVAMGRFAAQSLLKTARPVSRLRGTVHIYADTGIPLIVTYHPAYLLRTPGDKRKAWEDLLLARETLG